jgi:hypothetical protein
MPKTARRKNPAEANPVSAPPADATSEQVETSKSQEAGSEPSPEAIAKRAYEIFLERGGAHGKDSDDWLQAELELRAKTK